MTALAKALSRTSSTSIVVKTLRNVILMFCGASLFVWLLTATYGLDLSAGFF